MTQARYGNSTGSGRRIVMPVEEEFAKSRFPGFGALRTSVKTMGLKPTAAAVGAIAKPQIASGLRSATSTPGRTVGTLAGVGGTSYLLGRNSGLSKAHGAGKMPKFLSTRAPLHMVQGPKRWENDRRLFNGVHQMRTNDTAWNATMPLRTPSGGLPSLRARDARLESDSPLRHNRKKIAKAYDSEHRRQRRYGMYEAGLGLAGGAALLRGGKGIRQTSGAFREMSGMRAPANKAGDRMIVERALKGRATVLARGKDLAYAGGGAAGLTGAALVRAHAEGRRGRAYN